MPSQEGYFINHQLFHPVSLVAFNVSHLSNKYRYRSVKIQISMREYWRYIWSPPWTLVVLWILSVPIILLCWRCCHMMVLWRVGRNRKGGLVGRGWVTSLKRILGLRDLPLCLHFPASTLTTRSFSRCTASLMPKGNSTIRPWSEALKWWTQIGFLGLFPQIFNCHRKITKLFLSNTMNLSFLSRFWIMEGLLYWV